MLPFVVDTYKSAILGLPDKLLDPLDFESLLFATIKELRIKHIRGVWLKLETKYVDYIAPAVRVGFSFHSSTSQSTTLTCWLPKDEENKLPPCPSHFVGVGCFLLNSKDEVLVVREKSGPSATMKDFFKLPGGLCDQQEDIPKAAVRELREETSIDAEFISISSIQEVHHMESRAGPSRTGTTDLYCICVLRALNENQPIIPCENEIAEARWMKASDLLALPFYAAKGSVFSKMFHHAYDVAIGKSPGLGVERMNLGFRDVQNNVTDHQQQQQQQLQFDKPDTVKFGIYGARKATSNELNDFILGDNCCSSISPRERAARNFSPASRDDSPYLQVDWGNDVVIRQNKSQRFIVDFSFHRFTDLFGLSEIHFTDFELLEAMRDIINTWAVANIYIRFKFSDLLEEIPLSAKASDAYRWWIQGNLLKTKNKEAFARDFESMLRSGPASEMGQEDADRFAWALEDHKGHTLLNRIFDAHRETTDIGIFAVPYYPYYNGGTVPEKMRIFVRAGSCNSNPPRRVRNADSEEEVKCKNFFPKDSYKRSQNGNLTTLEFARILAHEIGHILNLGHPGGGQCQVAQDVSQLQLMRQQRAVSLKGKQPCSESNPVSKYARYLDDNEIKVARAHAEKIMNFQAVVRSMATKTARIDKDD